MDVMCCDLSVVLFLLINILTSYRSARNGLSPLVIEDNFIFVFEGVASDITMRLKQ